MPNCAKQGCKRRAKRGSIFCAAHDPDTQNVGGAPRGNINRLRGGLTSLFTADEQDALDSFTPGRLNRELDVLRVILIRSFREDNRDRVIATTNALVKAEQAQRRLNGNQANDLLGAMEMVLAELGLGESEG